MALRSRRPSATAGPSESTPAESSHWTPPRRWTFYGALSNRIALRTSPASRRSPVGWSATWPTTPCAGSSACRRRVRPTHLVDHLANRIVDAFEGIGIGSDFDGGTHTPFDTTGLIQLTEALLADGFSQDEIRKIMGANVIRVLRKGLP